MRIARLSRFRKAARRRVSHFSRRGLILTYHSVTEPDADPWRLSVSPKHFAEHMEVLNRRARPVTLGQLAMSSIDRCQQPAVAITFDDGYENNLSQATPLLERHAVPATVFVSSGYVGGQREYWWDQLAGLLLHTTPLPAELDLAIHGSTWHWQLDDATEYTAEQRRRDMCRSDCNDPNQSSRLAFYFSVWEVLQPLSEADRNVLLEALANWSGQPMTARSQFRPVTTEELAQLAQSEFVTIGGHTVTHPMLSGLRPEQQRQEIAQGKRELETILGHPITSFSYPFGAYNKATLSIVRDAGFDCACTVAQEVCWAGSRRYQLPRFDVLNWDGDEFSRRLAALFAEV